MHSTFAARRDTWLFWIAALLILGAGLGLRDPWPADEPRFALVARHMVESGDWLFPHRGIELYSDKPPLLMWLQAAFYTVLRDWRIAFLLPSLLASLGTLWCVVDLGRRLWTRQAGVYAGWALLLALQFAYQSKKAQIDPLVTFWITLANYGLLRHLLCGPHWKLWLLGWFAAGLGVISKGVGVVALLMLVPALYASLRNWPRVRLHARSPWFWCGPLALLAAIGLWLVPMVVAALGHPDPAYRAYLDDILFRQTAKRYANAWGHHKPAWYFVEVMATMWLPTVLALPWAIPAWARRLRRRDPRILLPLAWCVLVLVFFSIPVGKRDMYILPALPMLCLALAPVLPGIVRRAGARRLAFAFATVLAVVPLAAGAAMLLGNPHWETKLVGERGLDNGAALAAMFMAMGACGLAAIAWYRVRGGVQALAWTIGGIWVVFGLVAHPLLNPSSSASAVMAAAAKRIGPDAQLGLVAWKEQNLLMTRAPTTDFGFKAPWHVQWQRGLAWQAADPAHRWLFAEEPALNACIRRSAAEFIGISNRRRWWLVPAWAAVPGCVPTAAMDSAGDDDA